MDLILCEGGPLDGMRVPCRNPEGLLLTDKAGGRALVYDRVGPVLSARQSADELDAAKVVKAALEDRFDVLAYDGEVMGAWQ